MTFFTFKKSTPLHSHGFQANGECEQNLAKHCIWTSSAGKFMRNSLIAAFVFILGAANIATAQNQQTAPITVKGTITDGTNNLPVPGVTVKLKGTSIGTTTDQQGAYSLNVPTGEGTLVVSFIGFITQELVINGRSTINVILAEQSKGLSEIVVVGHGTQKRRDISGSIVSVKASDLQDQQIARFDDALQGRAAGVSVVKGGLPGAAPSIRIRGTTSINNTSPLYVIDGIVVDNGGLDAVNPNDIESIDVLKDASAAIYGSRASAGVILVTTKKGKSLVPQVSYNGYYGIQSAVKKVELANATQYAMLRNQAAINDGGTAPFANPSQYGVGTNWQDVIFGKSVPVQSHNLSLSGATDKLNYYTSFGYFAQTGIVSPSIAHYKRGNFTANTSYKITPWLTIGENLTLAVTRGQGSLPTNSLSRGPLSSALILDPLTPVVITDINAQPNASVYNNFAPYILRNADGLPYGISNQGLTETYNPLAYEAVQQGNYFWGTNILGSGFVEIAPIAGLKLRSQLSMKGAYYGSHSFTPLYFLSTSENNLVTNSEYNDAGRNLTLNWDNTITYSRSFGLHNMTLLGGTSAQTQNGHSLNGTFYGEPISSYQDASINYSLPSASRVAGGADNQPYKLASVFGRLTYNYDRKYLLNVTVRRDGSSKFGPDNKYGVFPAVELGYVLSQEKFFPKNKFIDFLKIRGSYGILGNEQSLSVFQYTSTIGSGRNYLFGNNPSIGYSPEGPATPDLKWEEVRMTNIGLDAAFFGKLDLTVDFYRKSTEGILQKIRLPGYTGAYNSPFGNIEIW